NLEMHLLSNPALIFCHHPFLYLLQSPPSEKAYSYSGNGIYLKPFCESISSICNLKRGTSSIFTYNCPESFWLANGTVGERMGDPYNVVIPGPIYDSVNNKKNMRINPIDLIVSAMYTTGNEKNLNDSEFVTLDGGKFGILMHCQIFSSTIEYLVTLGSLKVNSFGNLTNVQLVAIASATRIMTQLAIDDVMDIAYSRNSTLYLSEFAQRFAQETISSFVGAVQENMSGYDYVLEATQDETIVPLSAVLLYVLIITLPLWVFSGVGLCSIRNPSTGVRINWILAEFLCAPQRLFYRVFTENNHERDDFWESLSVQERMMAKYECRIGEKVHFQILENNNRSLAHKETI
ncbi:15005_t:CDS:1, partial [Acaulospora morrowiae]